jgi:class III poly(R)-hydroxyalkanoic acid synthase PhaE subunit
MSETESQTSSNPWNEQWLKQQRAYWDAWRSLLQVNTGNKGEGNPWMTALDSWYKAMNSGMSGGGAQLYSQMLQQSQALFNVGQQMNDLFRAVTESTAAGTHWQEALKQNFDAMKQGMNTDQAKQQRSWTDQAKHMGAFFELPLDTWRRMCSGASMMPGDFLQSFRSQVFEGMGEKLHGDMDRFLSVPGVGYTREGQEQVQQLGKLVLDYQKASQEYLNAHTKLGAAALDRLYRKIIAVTEKGDKITSLRQLYDLWVDASEEVYGGFAMSPEFRDLYGKMVNALMRVKGQMRAMVDEVLGAFNMPTRREMNTVLKRQHELKRELRNLAHGGNGNSTPPRGRRENSDRENSEMGALRSELAALQDQVSALQAELKAQPVAVANEPKKPTRRERQVPSLHAVDSSEPLKEKSAARRQSAEADMPSRSRQVKTVSSWDISSIVADDGKVSPIHRPRRGDK